MRGRDRFNRGRRHDNRRQQEAPTAPLHDRRSSSGNRQEGGTNPSPGPGGRERRSSSPLGEKLGIGGFDLFCAYHLGITTDDRYAFQNIHEVARRFKTNAGVIRQLLTECDMDPENMVHSSFDLASAQVDIMVAPEGVSRRELARELYQEFRQAPRRSRDWAKEIAEDARDNERMFGRR